jgi:hypothetical protein
MQIHIFLRNCSFIDMSHILCVVIHLHYFLKVTIKILRFFKDWPSPLVIFSTMAFSLFNLSFIAVSSNKLSNIYVILFLSTISDWQHRYPVLDTFESGVPSAMCYKAPNCRMRKHFAPVVPT